MNLDGLRGLAALVVVVFHCRLWIDRFQHWHGFLAVDFFFLLSGFVIEHAYGEKLRSGRLAKVNFVKARILRLYPLIVLGALVGSLSFIIEALHESRLGLAARAIAALPFGVLALPQPFFRDPFQPNGPAWSLFFELIANGVFALVVYRLSFRSLAALAALLSVGLALAIMHNGGVAFGWLWPDMLLGLLRVGAPFTLGIVLYRVHRSGRLILPSLPIWLTAIIVATLLLTPIFLAWRLEILFTIFAIFGAFPLLIMLSIGSEPTGAWLRIARQSALISYPIYIVHKPLQHILDFVPGYLSIPVPIRLALMILICILAATAARLYFDEPIRAWLKHRQARSSRRPSQA